jgi:transposase
MPDPADVLAAYRQVGSVSALADHYGVPRHTVQGWARRLRREGYDIGRSA